MDFQRLILDHVTIPERARPVVTELGWRVRLTRRTTRFEVTIDGGDTWSATHSWDGPISAGHIVRAGREIFSHYRGARIVEYEEVNGVWIPRIEQEEEE